MLDKIMEGFLIGFKVALPIGPVAITLISMVLTTKGWNMWPLASFWAGMSIVAHTTVALVFQAVILQYVKEYAVQFYFVMGVAVALVALNAFMTGRKIDIRNIRPVTKVYTPALISLLCPFIGLLVLNLFLGTERLQVPFTPLEIAVTSLATGLSGAATYFSLAFMVFRLSEQMSLRVSIFLVKLAPIIVLFYSAESLYQAYVLWF
ncbi:MAG: hypothetical protein OXC30_05795 [Alphaproteobacteria bacterium]|nr:hypothetical protein [Alphaproteobacteria bacterium]